MSCLEIRPSFLDNLERIAVPDYEPTDGTCTVRCFSLQFSFVSADDILRARLKTLGATEHRFTVRSSA